MPKILEEYVKGIMRKWKSKSSAYAIATSQLQKKWILKRWSQKLSKKLSKKKKKKKVNLLYYV